MHRQILWLLLVTLAAGCATPLPEALRPSAGETLSLVTMATGVQIYECTIADGQYRWTFKAPEAELFDRTGRKIGNHYAGPTWELDDGSKITGTVQARADAPDATAIPWLRLAAKSAPGNGALNGTTSILRLDTVGGLAPSDGCGAAQAGKQARVAYKATYHYYRQP